ncbi:MAG: hypothetical protein LBJ14_07375 [Desulfarculales bacterium]|jgi:hypothetical protein|nr:hypothetical protein [Desulfarculales bacterium]
METRINDIMLVYHGDLLLGFARVEDLTADVKPGWWQISLMLLKMPLQYVTWILRDEYIDGRQFTMGGEPMRLERLARPGKLGPVCSDSPALRESGQETGAAGKPGPGDMGKVIALRPRKPKNQD